LKVKSAATLPLAALINCARCEFHGRSKRSAPKNGQTMKQGWQYWTFLGVSFAASVIVTIWVTKIAREALKSQAFQE
jgi:hypothetical protein